MDLKSLKFLFVLLIYSGCQNLRPDVIIISSYPMIDSLFNTQVALLDGKNLQKMVMLGDEKETQRLVMDSSTWNKELAFLEEINPNRPEYRGAFKEINSDRLLELKLDENEKGSLKKLSLEGANGIVTSIQAIIHEDKDVYVHHQEIEITLSNGQIASYSIAGYQKIILKDTIKFRIEGEVL